MGPRGQELRATNRPRGAAESVALDLGGVADGVGDHHAGTTTLHPTPGEDVTLAVQIHNDPRHHFARR